MRIIHTGDWHIGQLFYDHDRELEHRMFFEWLRLQIREFGVDVLLIAGDVFDSPNPSAAAQRMFYEFIDSLDSGVQVIVIAGNHDSSARLEAPIPILESRGVVVRGVVTYGENGEIDFERFVIPVMERGKVRGWCAAVPYLRRGDYPLVEVGEGEDAYVKGVAAMYERVLERVCKVREKGQFILAMGHLHASGAEISDSERVIVGGMEYVDSAMFGVGTAYTALGHLHKAQRVGGRENVRYAGSPLPMSFAERNYNHGVTLIDLEGEELKSVEHLSYEPFVKLLSIPRSGGFKAFEEVRDELIDLPDGEIVADSPFLEVKIVLDSPKPSLRYDVENLIVGKSVRLMRIVTEYRNADDRVKSVVSYEDMKKISPIDMAREVYVRKYGEVMPGKLEKLLDMVMEDLG